MRREWHGGRGASRGERGWLFLLTTKPETSGELGIVPGSFNQMACTILHGLGTRKGKWEVVKGREMQGKDRNIKIYHGT